MRAFRIPIFPLANLILAHRIMILLIFTKPSHSKWKVLHFAQKMGTFSKEKSAIFVQIASKKPLAEARGFLSY